MATLIESKPAAIKSAQTVSGNIAKSKPANTFQRIAELGANLNRRLRKAVSRFDRLNSETKFVALNARIEAGRASGTIGRSFEVVAKSIQDISDQSGDVAAQLSGDFQDLLDEMKAITEELVVRSRGERLADLALMNIDLIDRNLYERSCDVRWWATDQSVVDVLLNPNDITQSQTASRLGQILDSYTVYFDIIVANTEGWIVSNGRPNEFQTTGKSVAAEEWFVDAMRTRTGAEYVQSRVMHSALCNQERTIVYACAVRKPGSVDSRPIGVLAVIFRWDALAQTVVERTPLSKEDWLRTRVCILDEDRRILADTKHEFDSSLEVGCWKSLTALSRGYRLDKILGVGHCIAIAQSPRLRNIPLGLVFRHLATRLAVTPSQAILVRVFRVFLVRNFVILEFRINVTRATQRCPGQESPCVRNLR